MSQELKDSCVKKTNQLVYPKPTGERHDKPPSCYSSKILHRPPICRIKPKPIRVCSRTDMKKMVPPPKCECKVKRIGGKGGLSSLLLFGLKAAIAAGVVYVSYDVGIWGTIDQTQEMYKTLCTATTTPQKRNTDKWSPPSCEAERSLHRPNHFNQYSHCDVSPIDLEESSAKWRSYWNSAVEAVFSSIASFPHNIINNFKLLEGFKRNISNDTEECIPYDQLPEEEKVNNTYK